MKYKILTSVMLTLSVMLIIGCSDRAVEPNETKMDLGTFTHQNHVFEDLQLQVKNSNGLAFYQHFIPEISQDNMDHPMPLLVLLAPEGEDEFFYVHHGLGELASQMIADGEIEPMVIVTIPPEAISVFGGFFYAGDQFPGGRYDNIFADSLLPHLIGRLSGKILDEPSKRGIGGIGMGAYGAFRAALLSPGQWGSVSAVDGPLDFDGADGSSGLIDLMDSVFVEQPYLTAANMRSAFDSSSSHPISRFFCGGGLAFTPHDQDLDSLISIEIRQLPSDLTEQRVIHLDSLLRGSIYHILADSTTLIDSLITQDAHDFDFHLPFGPDSIPYFPIWDIWMEENLENLYTGSELMNTDVWMATSTEAKWGYHDMTTSWAATLGQDIVTVHEYEGYEGRPATGNQYMYDLLRDILKFHSESFNK